MKIRKIEIRKYQFKDLKAITRLFYETVHTVNAKDYTKEQLNVWATDNVDLKKWDESLCSHRSYVAVIDNLIVGFGDIDETGYLDRLFVHKDYQKQGIGTAICDKLESAVKINTISVHVSITAKSFFEDRGYITIKEQYVERNGISLKNYIMEKHL